jgi:6-phosphogluconolactonase
MSVSEFRTTTQAELTLALADFVESELSTAVAKRGQASLVVSGGSTPKPLFEALSHRSLTWDKITITLADERWVDSSSKDSNEAMIRETLLCNTAAEANFVSLKNSAETAEQGQVLCEQAIADIELPFDLVILGMGEDGHTASLFPGVAGLALDSDKPELCAAIKPSAAPHERMSLTARAILNSQKIILHIVGDKKWQVYREANSPGLADELPIRVVLHQDKVPVDVYWSP